MITIKDKKIIIEIPSPLPKEDVRELQMSIIQALQKQLNRREETTMNEEEQAGNYFLLEFLKHTLEGWDWTDLKLDMNNEEATKKLLEEIDNVLGLIGQSLRKD